MAKVLVRGDAVYECDVCKRRVRVPAQRRGIDVVQRCIVTNNCQGKLHRIRLTKEINETPAFPPEVAGLQDWSQRRILHIHEQQVQSAKWIVNHDLANNPNIYVYVTRQASNTEVDVPVKPKQINIIDLNTIEIVFDQAERGLAQCIASASKNLTNPIATAGVAATSTDVCLTNKSEITIATADTADNVNLILTFNSPSSTLPVVLEYTGINKPSVYSAWNDAEFVIINGRRYRVRSFNIVTTNPAPTYFGQGAIASGSSVVVSNALKANEVMILLAKPPHAVADKVTQNYIDCSNLTGTPYLYLNQGELYAQPTVIKSTYPPIIVA